ncbi:MAG TPA: hypothetical protein VGI81_09155 [Tepidisphaeraceae bacterium]
MRSLNRRAPWHLLLLVTSLVALPTLTACAASGADEAGANAAPAEIGSVSVASLNRLSNLAKKIGVDLPPFLTAAGIEKQFPFLGQGGLDQDRPIGIIFYGRQGWVVSKGQGVVFVLPVQPGAAPLKAFTDAGAKPKEGNPGVVEMNGAAFRRTTGELLFGTTAPAVAAVREAELTDLYGKAVAGEAAPGAASTEARMIFDVKALRDVDPEQFKAFFDNIVASSAPNSESERQGQELAIKFMRNLDRVDLTLGEAARDLQLRCAIAPAKVPPGGTFQKPALPREAAVRIDFAASPIDAIPNFDDGLKTFVHGVLATSYPHATPEIEPQVSRTVRSAADVFLGGQAISAGFVPQGKGGVLYLVEQHFKGRLDERLSQLAEQFNASSALLDKPPTRSEVQLSHYADAAGLDVTRLQMSDGGKVVAYIDGAQQGSTALFTFSDDPGRSVASLAGQPPGGPMSGLATGQVDVQRVLEAVEKQPDSPLANMKPDQRKQLMDLARGQMIRFAAHGESNSMVLTVITPEQFIKGLAEFAKNSGGAANVPNTP